MRISLLFCAIFTFGFVQVGNSKGGSGGGRGGSSASLGSRSSSSSGSRSRLVSGRGSRSSSNSRQSGTFNRQSGLSVGTGASGNTNGRQNNANSERNFQNNWNSWSGHQSTANSGAGSRDVADRQIVGLLFSSYLGGRAVKKIAQYNTKSFLIKYQRSYWIGDRHYYLDPDSQKASRVPCFYALTAEDPPIFYEDDTQVRQIVFQCKKYFERCCGMDCCKTDAMNSANSRQKNPFHTYGLPHLLPIPLALASVISKSCT